ncbi:hypothetical protein C3H43_06605 [Campylobacter jejuni]|uniref:hypothetical protein n=1 Tax=Campylobacter jejuni TaxID=197 RepID=UPI000F7FF463|nr:hypothetical protein [Campylobacter jejuni]RTJ93488.1 hypothetical protein C3H43_06605 [Campylobacter jejuni]
MLRDIKRAINFWQFDIIDDLYISSKNIDVDFCQYLYKTGQFDRLIQMFKNKDLTTQKPLNIPFVEIQKCINLDLLNNSLEFGLINIPNEIIACYLLNYHIKKNILDIKITKELFSFIFKAEDSLSTDYFLYKVIQYYLTETDENRFIFFVPIHWHDLGFIIPAKLSNRNTTGSKIYYNIFINEMKYFLEKDFSKIKSHKMAICVYGIFRGNWKKTIEKILAEWSEVFDADVFLFSWDEMQVWPGFSGGSSWIQRHYGEEVYNQSPIVLRDNEAFMKNLPNVALKVSRQYCEPLEKREIYDLQIKYPKLKCFSLEKQEEFIYSKDNYYKMFYGIYQSFKLMENYEKSNGFKYDYVILFRSDYEYFGCGDQLKKEIYALAENEIIENNWYGGNGNGIFIAKRGVAEKYMTYYKNISKININYTRKMNNHDGIFKQLAYEGIIVIRSKVFDYRSNTTCSEGYKLPNIHQELNNDLKKSNYTSEIKQSIVAFFKKFNFIDDKYKYYNIAKTRIQNQLSYKLGQTLILNSKSVLGYLSLPFIILSIVISHKQEQKAYKFKVKKNPNLALPPLETYPDYNEALKEKECFTYKLGEAFIKASKNWYKGGYIKFILKDVPRLKRLIINE